MLFPQYLLFHIELCFTAKAVSLSSKTWVQRIFSKIEEKTGITVTPHIMRHTFATQALTGTGVEVVQQMLGHSDISTTMIYAEVDQRSIYTAHLKSVI